jgi:hypothetical protein
MKHREFRVFGPIALAGDFSWVFMGIRYLLIDAHRTTDIAIPMLTRLPVTGIID